jgi:outer membrane protein OmpA-like peptidoglycan-associated protein
VKIHPHKTFLMTGATCAALLGCAHQGPPPNELAEARAVYQRASAGPAAKHAGARLKLAKQALDSAELAYGAASTSEVQDRAYIAIRRAEAAEAEASTIAAIERRSTALKELATLTGVHADRARAELASANQKANEAGQRADLAQAQVTAEQGRTLSAQQLAQQQAQRAQTSESQLATEKQARSDAEARAQQAMNEVARLAQVRQDARGVVITLSGQVLFATDQAQLLPAAQTSLDGVAAALKQVQPNAGRITVEGHTDSTGQRGYNVDLSRRRAEAVKNYLVEKGVNRDLFAVEGIGPDRPVASNRTPEGRANNRRVEIVIPSSAMALDKIAPTGGSGTTTPGLSPASTTQTDRTATPGTTAGTPTPSPATPVSSTPSTRQLGSDSVAPSPATSPASPTATTPSSPSSPSTTSPATTTPATASPPAMTAPVNPNQIQPPPVTPPATERPVVPASPR